ncbi:branched-chain amino acid transport system II carrier protein [Oceanivirga miroungae]|uniref:Branched-chain amino acid transport system 2 carrier protein n=1 Tax=Oceanivirga miroungae TaxID=1130046 RepID=A0A6I8MAA5_9FUSO|nr:branched-chain amino acid transport system II carrier protein [Oceanivirga miroungae]VWL85760.1 Branched-chain amino acid transport system 2 carrier protein [Oceanivirga miroungae]
MGNIKKTIILGFGLFSMFFGASNVFLPSYIGAKIGENFLSSAVAFSLTGVGLTLLGLIVVIKSDGDYLKIFEPLGEKFSKTFLILAFLSVGPIIAIPRTAATTFEMGVKPFFPNFSGFVVTLIFFVICILFSINKNDVVSEIAKYLTPILLISIVTLIIFGIFNVDKNSVGIVIENPFAFSFLEGYNTLDAIAAIIFARFIYHSVQNEKNPVKISINASIIAAIGLFVVYTGIMYLGKTINIADKASLDRTLLMVKISGILLGKFGNIVLGIIISFACLTTAIGLISAVSEFFYEIFKEKIKYIYIVCVITFVSFLISQLSVDIIIQMAVPILLVFYPVLIVLIILSLFKGRYINRFVIKYTTYTTLVFAIIDRFYNFMPFNSIGMAWIIPTIIAFLISSIISLGYIKK